MLTVHHLENSRSHRIVWLLEELGVDYEIRRYGRDKQTGLAPPELLDVLEAAVVVDSLEQAVADCQYVVGTSARGRRIPWPVLDPRRCA